MRQDSNEETVSVKKANSSFMLNLGEGGESDDVIVLSAAGWTKRSTGNQLEKDRGVPTEMVYLSVNVDMRFVDLYRAYLLADQLYTDKERGVNDGKAFEYIGFYVPLWTSKEGGMGNRPPFYYSYCPEGIDPKTYQRETVDRKRAVIFDQCECACWSRISKNKGTKYYSLLVKLPVNEVYDFIMEHKDDYASTITAADGTETWVPKYNNPALPDEERNSSIIYVSFQSYLFPNPHRDDPEKSPLMVSKRLGSNSVPVTDWEQEVNAKSVVVAKKDSK